MTAVTFSFNLAPAQGAAASHSAPSAGGDAALAQRYRAETANLNVYAPPANNAGAEQGPGVTTLALGEEDGGLQSSPAYTKIESLPHSSPIGGGDGFEVSTLAIGEEDGGGISSAPAHGGGMSPIQDDHSIIGNYVKASRPEGSSYGSMQPIYSPGEAEYAAFAKASQGPDVLNFTPVPRAKPTSVSVSYGQPVAVSQPSSNAASVAPVAGGAVGPAPIDTANYVSVGSYESFISGGAAATPSVPAAKQMMPATQAPEPQAPAPEMIDIGPLDPVTTAPSNAAVDIVDVAPEAASAAPAMAAVETVAPEPVVKSAEPEYVEVSLESYAAPAAGAESVPAAAETAPVEKSVFETYLAPANEVSVAPGVASAQTAPSAPAVEYSAPDLSAIPTAKPELVASVSSATTSVPAASPSVTPPSTGSSAPAVSMGGSYVVFEGQSAGAADAASAVAPAAEAGSERIADSAPASDELRVTTLAIGEEDGLGGGTWQP